MSMSPDDHYTIVSADCHAGASHEIYRDYLEARYHDDFDAWRGEYKNPFRDLQDGGRVRNWDNERRLGDLQVEHDRLVVARPEIQRGRRATGDPVQQGAVEAERHDISREVGRLARAGIGKAGKHDRTHGVVVADDRGRLAA